MQRAIDEHASYVVFNGSALSLVGDNALQAKVGERIRLFVGNGGPNLVSSFHVIGEIFDTVYFEGGMRSQEHVQTTIVPAGGSAIVEFKLDTNGTYLLVDHSLLRTFNKGALGMLKADGEQVKEIYSGKELDEIYLGDEAVATALKKAGPAVPTATPATRGVDGKAVFEQSCAMCHQAAGQGLEGVFPPLARSDYLMERAKASDRTELVDIIVNGKTGSITVNGKQYNGVMTPVAGLPDEDIAAVLTFITSNWGNAGVPPFTAEEVAKAREQLSAKASAPAGAAHP
jgi:nitrite reductase (NO-forming)